MFLRSACLSSFVAFAFSIFLVTGVAAQQPKVLAPHKPVPPTLPYTGKWHSPAVPRSMVGGLWMTDPNFKSSIYIKNSVKVAPITVTPILYLSNGRKYQLADVTLEPSGTAVVYINQALADNGIVPWAALKGYVEVDYSWPWDALCVTVRSIDVLHSVIFSYNLQPATTPDAQMQSTAFKSRMLEGIWWKQEPGVTGFVSISNPSPQPISANLQVLDDEANLLGTHTVTISPHGTKVVDLLETQSAPANEGGVHVTYNGPEHGLLVSGGLEDPATGFSANLPMHSPPKPSEKSATLTYAAVGFMTGEADPMMRFPAGTRFTPYFVLRNLTGAAYSIQPKLYWVQNEASRSIQLPQVSIPAYAAMDLNLASLISASSLKNFNGGVNLVFDFQGQDGALLMAGGSVDEKNTYVFEARAQVVSESAARSLSYWSTANGDDTMINLWNPADEAQDLVLTLFFSGGHYKFPLHLEPKAAQMLNVSEVIQNQIPDVEGNMIPPTVKEGSAEIAGPQGEYQRILMAVDAGIYNVQKATCTPICITCQGATTAWIDANPFAVRISGAAQETFTVQYKSGTQYNLTASATWGTSNASVATVNVGLVTGVNAGTANLTATTTQEQNTTVCSDDYHDLPTCPEVPVSAPSTPGNVTNNTPILTGIDPSIWPSGATTPGVTFSGQYFGTNAPTLTFSPSSGISYSLVSYNDTQIVANITVASGTPTEDVDVSVTNNGYGGLGFQSGGGAVSATSSPIYATVRTPLNFKEITIIAWVNGNAPDLNPLPTGENSTLQGNLQNGTGSQQASCALQVTEWVVGVAANIVTGADSTYANAWLVKNSANTAPPSTITPSVELAGGNYRLFNDFGSGNPLGASVGSTPDPCKTGLLGWASSGQPSQFEGYSSTSPSGQLYQIAEGRVGTVGQLGSETINSGRTVPWIWSAIEFNSANGTPTYNPPLAMFPTYYLYVGGNLTYTFGQSSVAAFTAKDDTYQLTPSDIP
jgi:hypothetical protein